MRSTRSDGYELNALYSLIAPKSGYTVQFFDLYSIVISEIYKCTMVNVLFHRFVQHDSNIRTVCTNIMLRFTYSVLNILLVHYVN